MDGTCVVTQSIDVELVEIDPVQAKPRQRRVERIPAGWRVARSWVLPNFVAITASGRSFRALPRISSEWPVPQASEMSKKRRPISQAA